MSLIFNLKLWWLNISPSQRVWYLWLIDLSLNKTWNKKKSTHHMLKNLVCLKTLAHVIQCGSEDQKNESNRLDRSCSSFVEGRNFLNSRIPRSSGLLPPRKTDIVPRRPPSSSDLTLTRFDRSGLEILNDEQPGIQEWQPSGGKNRPI